MALPLAFAGLLMAAVVTVMVDAAPVNNRPVIGVLSQGTKRHYGQEYLMSEYVKYLEMAGGSVVIVKGSQPLDYYVTLFGKINGVLFPGGGAGLLTSTYARTSRIMYTLAVKANDNGDFFPIWATCQGLEMMTVLTAGENFLSSTDAENLPLPLTLLPTYHESRLLGNAPSDIIQYLTTENVTAHYHQWGLATHTYKRRASLNTFYRAMSVNKGRKGVEFVSTVEAYNYPFYGVQWHPEKNIFVRRLDKNVAHTSHAIRVSQYMANFFVDEARKNVHKFPSDDDLSKAVVENDMRVYLPRNYYENFFYNVTKT